MARKILMALVGRPGSTVVSITALWACFWAFGHDLGTALEITAGLVAVRLLAAMSRRPRPVLAAMFVHKHLGQVVDAELKVGLGVAAAAYVLSWPIDRTLIAAFMVLNFLLQLGHCWLTQGVLKLLSARISKGSPLPGGNRLLIAGTGAKAKNVADMILRSPELDATIDGFLDYHKKGLWSYRDIPLIGHPGRLEHIATNGQVDAVILAIERNDVPLTGQLFAAAERMGVPVSVLPDIYQPTVAKPIQASLNGVPTVTYRAVPENRAGLLVKSFLDRLGALFGLLVTSPLLVITAIAIKLESKGPVLFRQKRAGINGKSFQLMKFRTMCVDAESMRKDLQKRNELSGPAFKIRNDPRLTRIGGFMRKYSIDELPQFINILRGDMSLVGPRPPLPSEVAQYEPWQRRKLSVKPGLTCIWQVSGRNDIDFQEWMNMDLEYIDNWSLWLDGKILVRTLPAVLKGRGAS